MTAVATKRQLPVLSVSGMKAAQRCYKIYLLGYVLRMRALVTSDALAFGTLFHLALEIWWLCRKLGMRGDDLLTQTILHLREKATEAETGPFDLVKALALITGYHYRWDSDTSEVIAVEAEFTTALTNPETGAASRTWILGGKIDVILREENGGDLFNMEHKTTSEDVSPGSVYWRRLALDAQVSTYVEGARSLGYDVKKTTYDVISKPRIQPKLATPEEKRKYTQITKKEPISRLYAGQREFDETPDEYGERIMQEIADFPNEYFARVDVPRSAEDLLDAKADAWAMGRSISDAIKLNRWPRNPDNCEKFGSYCQYFAVCTKTASINDPYLYKHVPSTMDPQPEAPTQEPQGVAI